MIKETSEDYFWPSFVDLMMLLFFVMLVLFVLSYKRFSDEQQKYKIKESEFQKIEEVKNNLKVLMSDKNFFIYENDYKRYRLAQDILFLNSKYTIDEYSIRNYSETIKQLINTGEKLKEIVENLKLQKDSDSTMKDLSYLIIISGRSSDLPGNDRMFNYELSYKRAFSLYNFWMKNIDFDFDSDEYHKLLDFQIAGNGIGGIGRFPKYIDGIYNEESEEKNQSFLIQIIPKIGELKNIEEKNNINFNNFNFK